MKRKGISPIIAVVLLIGLSVSLAVLTSNWITHWVSTKTETTGSRCIALTNYRIDSATYDNTTATLSLIVTNLGSTGLYGFSVQMYNTTNIVYYNYDDSRISLSPEGINETNPLTEARSVIIKVNLTDNRKLGMSVDKVRVLNKACPLYYAESKNINRIV
ncbi:MAG: hypothetical protein DRP03_01945 [Candidatus Aenigmatarchaeota archaeon]|nr:MAG: hypothetical protein DRP03_01945 [Candidatus Aenigmarchaeota archaeon]